MHSELSLIMLTLTTTYVKPDIVVRTEMTTVWTLLLETWIQNPAELGAIVQV